MEIKQIKTINNLLLNGPLLITPEIFNDSRGFFLESWNEKTFAQVVGNSVKFVLDTHSFSQHGVLRGLHFQSKPYSQGKLVRCSKGEVFDVIVDIRKQSPTFLMWAGTNLNSKKYQHLWIPPGFAHGFLTTSKNSELVYKNTEFWSKENEYSISWKDPKIAIKWPQLTNPFILSKKDEKALSIDNIENSIFF